MTAFDPAAASLHDVPLTALDGEAFDPLILRGRAALIVNVASRCGLTPQYEGLQRLYETYRDRGFVVVGTPCDQFAGQEPGDASEIAAFCSTSYAVTFPLTEKLEVNGRGRHPLYELLTGQPDRSGSAGDVKWNFEKFVVSPRGTVVARFRPLTPPDDPELVETIEAHLPAYPTPTWLPGLAGDVVAGDRVRVPGGVELTVSRIERGFLGSDDVLCLIEDSPLRWLAQPAQVTTEVRILSATSASPAEAATGASRAACARRTGREHG